MGWINYLKSPASSNVTEPEHQKQSCQEGTNQPGGAHIQLPILPFPLHSSTGL